MKAIVLLGALCAFTAVPALAQSSPSPAPPATPDPVAVRAQTMLHEFQTGKVDRSQLDAKMSATLSPEVLKQIQAKFGPLGDPQQVTFAGKQTVQDDNTAYVYRVTFKSGTFNEIFALDKDGKVSGFYLVAPQQ